MPARPLDKVLFELTGEDAPLRERMYGGDINEVFLIRGRNGEGVLKTNSNPLPGMFPEEARGLRTLSQCKAFRIPEIIAVDEGYLLMEHIPQGNKHSVGSEVLGRALAELHRISADHFGFSHDNYIGSLAQSNNFKDRCAEFYREERLIPQFELALSKGFRFRDLEHFLGRLDALIPEEAPSLVHGDLWSGNYMASNKGEPCLIDPAVSYFTRETDLAMMALFGGFPKNYIDAYQEVYPLQPEWKERIPLWQLYYVLVHLNLFGAGYYSRCMQIIKQYL